MGEMTDDPLDSLNLLHGSGSSDSPETSDILSGAVYENGRVRLEPLCIDRVGEGDRVWTRP